MDRIVRGAPGDHLAALARFEWGGGCGTGSERLYRPKHAALLVVQAAAQKWDDLARTLLEDELFGHVHRRGQDYRARLWKHIGIDWQAVLVGAALESPYPHHVGHRLLRGDASAVVTAFAEHAARHLSGPHEDWLTILAAQIAPGPTGTAVGSRTSFAKDDLPLLQAIARQVRRHSEPYWADHPISLLASLRRPEATPALQRALRLPVRPEVREAARVALASMSAKGPIQPWRFRVLVDGRPFADQLVRWELLERETFGRAAGGARTTADGHFEIPAQLTASVTRAVRISSPQPFSSEDPWFAVEVTRPRAGAVADVLVRTTQLNLALTGPQPPSEQGPLLELHAADQWGHVAQWARFRLPRVLGGVTLPQLGTGEYSVSVEAAGRAHWNRSMKLGAGATTVQVHLAPGADVQFGLGPETKRGAWVELHRMPSESERRAQPRDVPGLPARLGADRQVFRGLRQGRYTLEVRQERQKPLVRTFQIDSNSPAVIDLGTIGP